MPLENTSQVKPKRWALIASFLYIPLIIMFGGYGVFVSFMESNVTSLGERLYVLLMIFLPTILACLGWYTSISYHRNNKYVQNAPWHRVAVLLLMWFLILSYLGLGLIFLFS